VTGAIFVGEGHFTLKPIVRGDITRCSVAVAARPPKKIFSRAVFRFTGRVYNQITASLVTKVALRRQPRKHSGIGRKKFGVAAKSPKDLQRRS